MPEIQFNSWSLLRNDIVSFWFCGYRGGLRIELQAPVTCKIYFPQIIDKYESMEREHKLLHETVNAAENKLYDTRTEVVDLTR